MDHAQLSHVRIVKAESYLRRLANVYQTPSVFMTIGYTGIPMHIPCMDLVLHDCLVLGKKCSVLRFLGRSGEPHLVERGP